MLMPSGRPLRALTLSPSERDQLVALAHARSMPQALVLRRARGAALPILGHPSYLSSNRRQWGIGRRCTLSLLGKES
jgi:hypothetical protein